MNYISIKKCIVDTIGIFASFYPYLITEIDKIFELEPSLWRYVDQGEVDANDCSWHHLASNST